MADSRFDVATIGNAIVDIITKSDDKFLKDQELIKGAMTLIDADRASSLYRKMGPAIEASGGSAANTAAGVASLGGRAAFIGKVAQDVRRRLPPISGRRGGHMPRRPKGPTAWRSSWRPSAPCRPIWAPA
jgi:hypothetical protein